MSGSRPPSEPPFSLRYQWKKPEPPRERKKRKHKKAHNFPPLPRKGDYAAKKVQLRRRRRYRTKFLGEGITSVTIRGRTLRIFEFPMGWKLYRFDPEKELILVNARRRPSEQLLGFFHALAEATAYYLRLDRKIAFIPREIWRVGDEFFRALADCKVGPSVLGDLDDIRAESALRNLLARSAAELEWKR